MPGAKRAKPDKDKGQTTVTLLDHHYAALVTEIQGEEYEGLTSDEGYYFLALPWEDPVTYESFPPRLYDRLASQSFGYPPDIPGFPNAIERGDFDAAWGDAGRV